MSNLAVEINNLKFAYDRGKFTLDVEKLHIKQGEIYVVVGDNGSGKTTLTKLILGILKPCQGEIKVFSKDTSKLNLGEVGQEVGYLFQNPQKQLFCVTPMEELIFIEEAMGGDVEKAKEKAYSLLKQLDLDDVKDNSTFNLSRGEKQRLAIATILMREVKLIILDEPTASLDEGACQILYGIIDELKNKGVGFIIASHHNQLIERYKENQINLNQISVNQV